MEELWKPVVGFEGFYEVSDHGRVRSVDRLVRHWKGGLRRKRGRMLKASPMPVVGYPRVSLCREGAEFNRFVHSLVLEAFFGPRPEGFDACHADGGRTNNHLSNLRWDSRVANMGDRDEHGRTQRGASHYRAKLTAPQVLAIRNDARSASEIAREYGVTAANVSSIRNGRSWTWLEAA